MTPEIWKVASGTQGHYEVSNLGRVRRSDGLLLKQSVPRDRGDYPRVMLRHSGRRWNALVHRLVALTFLGEPPFPNAQARHLDGNHKNPRWDNLAWGTAKENAADRIRHGTTYGGPQHWATRLNDRQRVAIAASSNETETVLAKRYGVSRTTIQRIRKGAAGGVPAQCWPRTAILASLAEESEAA